MCGLHAAAHADAVRDGVEPDGPMVNLPEVRITGSSLPRTDRQTALPLTIITRDEIQRSGARSTVDVLQSLPMSQGATRQASAIGPQTQGFAGVSLRDLGEQYTLVLLNGHRVATFAGQTLLGAMTGVDLNTLPLSAIERIEVLSDGASALYGADAIAGVVNIITRRGLEINEATAGVSWPRGGAHEWRVSAIKGVGSLDDDAGSNLTLSASASRRTALRASQRDFAKTGLIDFSQDGQRYRLFGLSPAGSPANVYDDNKTLYSPYLAANGACLPGQVRKADACWYDYAAQADLLPQHDDQSLLASYNHQLAAGQQWQLDVLLSRSRSTVQQAPAVYAFPLFESTSPLFSSLPSARFTPSANDGVVEGSWRLDDLGPRVNTDTTTLLDAALRFDGRHQGWQWTSGLSHSVNWVAGRVHGVTTNGAVYDLVDLDGYNPFLPWPQQSAQAQAALRAAAYDGDWRRSRSSLWTWQALASRDLATLGGGLLRWSVGADLTHEQLRTQPSALAQARLLNVRTGEVSDAPDPYNARVGDQVGAVPLSAQRSRAGLFTEWLAPISSAWELGAALRLDHDTLGGQALTGKGAFRWRPSPGLMWRGSLGTGFKAPSLTQVGAPQQDDGYTAQAHDCTPDLQAWLATLGATCAANGSYPLLARGNPKLAPERSVQASLGLRIEPLSHVSVGVDAWFVNIRNTVGVLQEADVFANPQAFAQAWTLLPSGAAALQVQPLNVGRTQTGGLDFDVATRHATPLGTLSSRLQASTIVHQRAQRYPGALGESGIGQDLGGGATLRWRGRWSATLLPTRAWSHTLTLAFQSGYREAEQTVLVLDAQGQPTGETAKLRLKVPAFLTWDWLSTWQATSGLRLNLGVLNVLDTPPPLSINTGGGGKANMVGYDERYFDPRGRTVVLEARLSF